MRAREWWRKRHGNWGWFSFKEFFQNFESKKFGIKVLLSMYMYILFNYFIIYIHYIYIYSLSLSLYIYIYIYMHIFPGGASGKESVCQCRRTKRHGFNTWVGKIPWRRRRKRQATPVFLLGESHGQRSLVGYSSWDCKELYMTEAT